METVCSDGKCKGWGAGGCPASVVAGQTFWRGSIWLVSEEAMEGIQEFSIFIKSSNQNQMGIV